MTRRTDPAVLAASRAFFAERAASWEERFPDDGPRFAWAAEQLAPPPGATVVDVGCGTARATPRLAELVGPDGTVVAIDATVEMLRSARSAGRPALLVTADALALPLPDGCADAVLIAGLLPHLADPTAGLAEAARVSRPGARLAVFHPISRVALAARHQRVPSDDSPIAPARLSDLLAATGWHLVSLDDGDPYLALAVRV